MVEVVWTKKAISQLERAVKYIRDESGKYYAEIVLNRILSSTRFLDENPKMALSNHYWNLKNQNIDF